MPACMCIPAQHASLAGVVGDGVHESHGAACIAHKLPHVVKLLRHGVSSGRNLLLLLGCELFTLVLRPIIHTYINTKIQNIYKYTVA